MSDSSSSVPAGYCRCGCGRYIGFYKETRHNRGTVKGQPKRYVQGHFWRSSPVEYIEEDRGYDTPCWIWQLALNKNGYGSLFHDGQCHGAHRVYYERRYGPVTASLHLDHLCVSRTKGKGGSTACVNPDHLEPVTTGENQRRGLHTKLTAADAASIRKLLAETNLRQKDIAEMFGVSWGLISQIHCGRAWR